MADSYVIYTASGAQDTFNITFGYLDPAHVFVTVDNVPVTFTFPSAAQVELDATPTAAAKVRVYRVTPRDVRQVVWQNAANLTADDLNTSDLQMLYITQEAFDLSEDAMNRDGNGDFDAENVRITNVANPVDALDAVNKAYADTVIGQAEDYAIESEAWANKTDGVVLAGEFSSKAYAIGGTGVTNTAGKGAAKEWATKTGGTVDTVERSAKAYAVDDLKGAAGGSSKDWAQTAENTVVAGGEYSAKHYAAKTAADRVATAADRVQTGLDRVATGNDVVAANNAVLQAQAYADSMAFKDVVFITAANSPYYLTQAGHSGKMVSVDTSGGNVVIYLPLISGLTPPFVTAVKKATADTNTVTINRWGTDTINDGSTSSKVLSNVGGSQFIPDTDPAPDRWTTIDFGAAAGEVKNQVFVAGVGFTAGSSTAVTLTNTPLPSSSVATSVYFDGVRQHPSEWSLNTTTGVITFTSAIPLGVGQVLTEWVSSSVTIGTPSDGTVSYPKMSSGAIATTAEILSGTASKLVSAASLAPLYYGTCLTSSVTQSQGVDMPWDTEQWDDGNWHGTTNPERITVNFTGRVEIIFNSRWSYVNNGAQYAQIYKNGVLIAEDNWVSGTGNRQSISISIEDACVSGDYYTVRTAHGGTALTGANGMRFSVRRVK